MPQLVAPLIAPLALAALLACSHAAGLYRDIAAERVFGQNGRSTRALGTPELPRGCLYEGRWFTEGSAVSMRDGCLSCACARGALACRRRACSPLPDPPPHRCHVLHRRGSCCPELHCPDGVTLMEHGASSRFENEDFSDIATPASILHACVVGGTIYAAGSAMSSNTACEQCFCLGGARRCVRPKCLPPPAGCRPRPAPGACCPQRYYCDHVSTEAPDEMHKHDCQVGGTWISEGERVVSAEAGANCTQCFCLRGGVRCQPLACAPPLLGCTPLLRPGECCAHQYHCEHKPSGLSAPYFLSAPDNGLLPARYDFRALHTSKSSKLETTTKNTLSSIYTIKNTPTASVTHNHLVATTKVKRKTNEPPPLSSSQTPVENVTTTTENNQKPKFAAKLIAATEEETSTTESEKTSTEQPEGSVRIMINGTINCTAELSTSLPLNDTINDNERIKMETQPRIPIVNIDSIEAHTFYPNDIITDRSVNGDFDDSEIFTINVTSSLRTNTSHSTPKAPMPMSTITKIALTPSSVDATNSSKKTKGDYDYDYTEPTLPPSLPNLKIIPFVAADAVVDEKPSKETLTYPMLEREDKFPIYYPSVDSKDTLYATRREDVYNPTQYPVFVSEKNPQYPSMTHELDLTNTGYSNMHNNLGIMHEYAVSSSLGNRISGVNKVESNVPNTSSTFKLETPTMNLFSPPIETEGGFIPKGPGIMDDFYTVYSSTPASSVPHLTTSMQLDISKGECLANDGRRIPEGDTITLSCSDCTCAWGELHCSPRPCLTPPGCRRRPASSNSGDLCCGDLICEQENITTLAAIEITTEKQIENKTAVEISTQTTVPISLPAKNTNMSISNNTKSTSGKPIIENPISKTNISSIANESVNISKTTVGTSTIMTTTEMPSTKPASTTTTVSQHKEIHNTNNHSLEYDDEEEDEGFSFGSVLKLLLSEYESTTASQYKPTTRGPPSTKPTPMIVTTTKRPSSKPSIAPFIPLPPRPYNPPKKLVPQSTVNRIDHLVLGEATAIKKTTPRPATTTFKPVSSFKPIPSKTQITAKPATVTKQEEPVTVEHDEPKPGLGIPGIGPGLLKLAGCNIYGIMYRVGRIIAELSTPCEECWCTELGIQCKRLSC